MRLLVRYACSIQGKTRLAPSPFSCPNPYYTFSRSPLITSLSISSLARKEPVNWGYNALSSLSYFVTSGSTTFGLRTCSIWARGAGKRVPLLVAIKVKRSGVFRTDTRLSNLSTRAAI